MRSASNHSGPIYLVRPCRNLLRTSTVLSGTETNGVERGLSRPGTASRGDVPFEFAFEFASAVRIDCLGQEIVRACPRPTAPGQRGRKGWRTAHLGRAVDSAADDVILLDCASGILAAAAFSLHVHTQSLLVPTTMYVLDRNTKKRRDRRSRQTQTGIGHRGPTHTGDTCKTGSGANKRSGAESDPVCWRSNHAWTEEQAGKRKRVNSDAARG